VLPVSTRLVVPAVDRSVVQSASLPLTSSLLDLLVALVLETHSCGVAGYTGLLLSVNSCSSANL
jgi:hypothetical protein